MGIIWAVSCYVAITVCVVLYHCTDDGPWIEMFAMFIVNFATS